MPKDKLVVGKYVQGTLIAVAIVGLGLLTFSLEQFMRYTSEGHLIENLSLAFLVITWALALRQLFRGFSLPWLSASAVLLWACLRELDFQKKFTFRSVESIGFYTAPHVPLAEKLIVAGVLLPFLLAAAHLVWFAWNQAKRDASDGKAWKGYLSGITALGVIALGSEKVVGGIGQVIEEASELGISVLLFLLVLNRCQAGKRATLSSLPPAHEIRRTKP